MAAWSISYRYKMVPFLTFDIELGGAFEIGSTPTGRRRMVPLLGGVVSGAFSARVLPGGADWQLVHPDGTVEISARYILETPEGALIEVESKGIRVCSPEILARFDLGETVSPDDYYFRTAMRFFTAAPALRHLNDRLYSCHGQRFPKAVRLFINQIP